MTDQNRPGPGPDPQPPPGPAPGAAATTGAPPQPPPAQRPALRRSSTDKVISGVAGGLARTLDQDPVVVRIITVVLAVAFPPAFIAYLAAWLLVARDDEPSRSTTGGIAFREAGGVLFWIGVVLLAGALVASFDPPYGGAFSLLPLVLIGIGVALWTRDGAQSGGTTSSSTTTTTWPHTTPTTGAAVPATPTTTATRATRSPQAGPPLPGGTPPPVEPPAAPSSSPQPVPPGPPPPPRPKSPLGAITIGIALITTGVVAALDQVPEVPLDADPSHLAAVALLVLGLGQLVGALWGRARWLSLVAIFLIPPVLVGAAIRGVDGDFALGDGIDLGDGVGERVLVVDGTDVLPRDVGLMAGTVTVDLQDWDPSDDQLDAIAASDSDLAIDVGVGEVVLITPTDVPWRVLGRVGLGDASVTTNDTLVQRDSSDNLGSPLEVLRSGGPQDGPVLDIVVDLRIGELDLHTPPFTTPTSTEESS